MIRNSHILIFYAIQRAVMPGCDNFVQNLFIFKNKYTLNKKIGDLIFRGSANLIMILFGTDLAKERM